MASRYWVGGTGTWDGTDTTHWATSSGGAGGASVPTSDKNVFFDANSGGGTITTGTDGIPLEMASLTCTGFTGTLDTRTASESTGGPGFYVYGNVTLSTGGTYINLSLSITGTCTFTSVGKKIGQFVVGSFSQSIDGTVTLADDFSCDSPDSGFDSFRLVGGTFDANNFNVTTLDFYTQYDFVPSRTLNMGSGTWTLFGGFGSNGWYVDFGNLTGLTINCGTSTINIDGTDPIPGFNFTGAGFTYYNLNLAAAGTAFEFADSNSFNAISNSAVPGINIGFTPGITITVDNFNVSGVGGNYVSLLGAGGSFTLSKSSGVVSCNWLDITNCDATGGATWYAGADSTNGGGNTGWIFTAPPSGGPTGSFFAFF
jgi:hypothetical protein